MGSPLHHLPRLSGYLQVDLAVKRDDLFPMTGGGNKARKIVHILADAQAQGCNALVTTGGLQSNHARVTALAAAERGWRCGLVLHGNPKEATRPRGNLLLMNLAGAEIKIVRPSDIAQTMRAAIDTLRAEGHVPYQIPGGGHSVTGAMAYVEATHELRDQCQRRGWQPEWVVHASGTGTTQAGLVVGLEQVGWQTRVVGISVARRNPRGTDLIEQACGDVCLHLNMECRRGKVDFRDDWVGDGYEHADASILSAIHLAAEMEGLILDPTYTGKAFAALLDLVRTGEIGRSARVLFWHTGGLLNLMSSDHFVESAIDP